MGFFNRKSSVPVAPPMDDFRQENQQPVISQPIVQQPMPQVQEPPKQPEVQQVQVTEEPKEEVKEESEELTEEQVRGYLSLLFNEIEKIKYHLRLA